jgi:NADH oxidase (H2O2-forming)
MAELVQKHCESMGLRFILKTPLGKVLGKERVEGVMAGSENFGCDMVILATGVRPNLEIPNQLGLDIGALGGVRVSPSLQPYRKGRPVKDLYLAGDVIMCDSEAINGPTMSQLGSSAVRQGKVAGINAAGGHVVYPGSLGSWISQLGDLQVAGAGLSRGLADYYGVSIAEGKAVGLTRARYYPGGKQITVKLIAERSSRRIVGAQIVGGEEVTGRMNWLSGAILARVTAEEFVASYENAYCPPTSMVKDVVVSAAEELQRRL